MANSSFRLALSNDDESIDFAANAKSDLEDMFSEFMREPADVKASSSTPVPPEAQPNANLEPVPSNIPVTLLAKVVYAYRLVQGENVAQGRVGLAVIQYHQQSPADSISPQLRIVLYRSKADVLSTFSLKPACANNYVQSSGEYAQFRDDDQQFWSVCFDSPLDRGEFLQLVSDEKLPAEPIAEDPAVATIREANAEANSITSTTMTSTTKTSLLDRMAKMGQQLPQMLPHQMKQHHHGVAVAGIDSGSSSSDSDAQCLSTHDANMPAAKNTIAKWKPPIAGRPNAYPTPVLATTNTLIQYNSPPMTTASNAGVAMVQLDSGALPAHFSEMRMQNTEIRMNLSKLESRIDRVLDKIDALPTAATSDHPSSRTDTEAEIITLEERIVALRKENRELRLRQNSSNEMQADLEAERVRCILLEESIAAKEKDKAALRSELLQAQQDNAALQVRLNDQAKQQRQLEHDVEMSNLKAKLQIQEDEIKRLTSLNERLQSEIASSASTSNAAAHSTALDTVKQVLSAFYEQFHAAIETSADLTANQVLKISRSIIKKQAQNTQQ